MRLFVSPDGAIAVHQIDGWQEIEVCPVAERDTAREEVRQVDERTVANVARLRAERDAARQEAERLRGALLHIEGWGDDASDDWWKARIREALQPPDGTELPPETMIDEIERKELEDRLDETAARKGQPPRPMFTDAWERPE